VPRSTAELKAAWGVILTGFMGRRWLTSPSDPTGGFVPLGLITLLGAAMALVNAAKLAAGRGLLGNESPSVVPPATGGGKIEKLGDMDCYVVGKPTNGKAIVLIYDIYGVSDNCRHNCDLLAQAGYLVVMPDLFRGSGRNDPNFQRPDAANVDREILQTVVPFVHSKG
jgi:hypothetical protein